MSRHTLPDSLHFPHVIGDEVLGGMSYVWTDLNNLRRDPALFITTTIDGEVLTEFQLDQWCQFGFAENGTCWLFGRDALYFSRDDGQSFAKLGLDVDEHDVIGAIAPCDDAIVVALYTDHVRRNCSETVLVNLRPRAVKISTEGDVIWSSQLPLHELSFGGCVQKRAETGWVTEPIPPQPPRSWLPFGEDVLLYSGGFVLLNYAEYESGLGCHYVLDVESGEVVWNSDPGPIGHAHTLPEGQFLLGLDGYGAWETHLYANGDLTGTSWATNGISFLTDDGRIMQIQMSNDSTDDQCIVELHADGEVTTRSKELPGYSTSNVLRTSNGTVYFWRDGQLWAWDDSKGLASVGKIGLGDGSYTSLHKICDERLGLSVRPREADRDKPGLWAVMKVQSRLLQIGAAEQANWLFRRAYGTARLQ